VLNDRIPDFEAIKDTIVSLPAYVLLNMDTQGEPLSVKDGYPRVAAEVFILGYPRGLTKQGVLPIWKRGSIASEPLFNVMDGAPAIWRLLSTPCWRPFDRRRTLSGILKVII